MCVCVLVHIWVCVRGNKIKQTLSGYCAIFPADFCQFSSSFLLDVETDSKENTRMARCPRERMIVSEVLKKENEVFFCFFVFLFVCSYVIVLCAIHDQNALTLLSKVILHSTSHYIEELLSLTGMQLTKLVLNQ